MRMEKRRSFKDKMIWIKSGVCILLGFSVAGGIWFKVRKDKKGENLEEIAKEFFNSYLKERMEQIEKEEIKWDYQLNQIEILEKCNDEFLIVVNYDLILDDEYEREYTTEQWTIKIKQGKGQTYEVIDQGEKMTYDNVCSK